MLHRCFKILDNNNSITGNNHFVKYRNSHTKKFGEILVYYAVNSTKQVNHITGEKNFVKTLNNPYTNLLALSEKYCSNFF